ncbi:hypothetical protein FQA39_LY19398 [Lamprigera yunnana]|nr:hypothetical protein FQA39_LY19398 [Lamprigera yunnana]
MGASNLKLRSSMGTTNWPRKPGVEKPDTPKKLHQSCFTRGMAAPSHMKSGKSIKWKDGIRSSMLRPKVAEKKIGAMKQPSKFQCGTRIVVLQKEKREGLRKEEGVDSMMASLTVFSWKETIWRGAWLANTWEDPTMGLLGASGQASDTTCKAQTAVA